MNISNLMIKKNKIDLSIFFFFLFPTLLVSGPFLTDLFVAVTVLTFIFQTCKNKDFYYYKNYFFLYFLVFYLYILINSIFINFELINFLKTFAYLRFGLFVLAIFYFMEKNSSIIKAIFYGFIFIFTILILDSFFQLITHKNVFGVPLFIDGDGIRLSSLFGDELILGSFLIRTLPVFFGIYFYLNVKNYYIFLPLFCILFFIIILSGERTAFVYMMFLILFLIFIQKISIKKLILTLSIFLLISLSYFILNDVSKIRIFTLTVKQYEILKNKRATNLIKIYDNQNEEKEELKKIKTQNQKYLIFFKNIIPKQHFDHYHSALKMFNENKIMGVGIKGFRLFCNDEKYKISDFSCSSHPHNTYVQLLAETGLIGFLIVTTVFVVIIFVFIKYIIFKIIKKKVILNEFQLLLLFSATLSLWPLIPSGNFFNNWLSTIYYFPAGLFLWSKKGVKKFNHKG